MSFRGVEEPDDLARQRIAAAEIRSLVKIAAMTAPTEIVDFVGAAVLSGNHVLDVKCGCGRREVRKMTVTRNGRGPAHGQIAGRIVASGVG